MFGLFKKKNIVNELKAPVSGQVIPVTEVKDEVFSSCMLGKGIAVVPSSGTVVAPVAGEISVVMEGTNHAVGIKLDSGMDLLIHIGLDTVSLNGEGFTSYVKMGDKVTAGQKLIDFDSRLIKEKGLSDEVIFIVLDGENTPDISFTTGIRANAGETVVANW